MAHVSSTAGTSPYRVDRAAVLLTVVLAYAVGLWTHTLHWWVGIRETSDIAFVPHWLRDSTLSVPLVLFAVVVGRGVRPARAVFAVGVAVAAAMAIGVPAHAGLFGQATHSGHTLATLPTALLIPVEFLIDLPIALALSSLLTGSGIPVRRAFRWLRREIPASRISWPGVALLALIVAAVDGFWLTSLQGAIGAVERNGEPFARWARNVGLMAPVFLAAIVLAVVAGDQIVRRVHRRVVRGLVVGLVIAGATTVVALTQIAMSSAWDYHLQANRLALVHATHPDLADGRLYTGEGCTGLCAAQNDTLGVHVKAFGYSAVALPLTNLLLVGWVGAMCGGNYRSRCPSRSTVPLTAAARVEPMRASPVPVTP